MTLTACEYGIKDEVVNMRDGTVCGYILPYIEKSEKYSNADSGQSKKDDLLLPDRMQCSYTYRDITIAPEDELALMNDYCIKAASEGLDTSEIMQAYINAEAEFEAGSSKAFCDVADRFYALYDEICCGEGGHLFVSGDYLSFSPEKVKVKLYCPYI
ncbi:hypothetical protein J2128_001494 [Methanomicrobium sp. W14]|uniref:hypothetical protein n=1 Tax=Methanomicrobium sp. W14 TaxID=2817839 RepID=UPI001AE8D27B|nr:hypothetical protein [Methanomicrobium sp. W14]MBP2133540.1 hypothetical protein [Methanomicrobium sp. W14]